MVDKRDLDTVVVETTVMEKAVAHPTDSRLYYTSRERLVKLARRHGVALRQSYTRKAKATLHKVGRYGHARQFKRLRRETRRLKTWLGRVVRDIERKTAADADLQAAFAEELSLGVLLDEPTMATLSCFATGVITVAGGPVVGVKGRSKRTGLPLNESACGHAVQKLPADSLATDRWHHDREA